MNIILLVDDSPDTLEILKRVIQAQIVHALKILTANTLQDAMTAVHASPSPVKLAVVDLALPDGCGEDMIRFLQRHSPITEIIVATAFYDTAELKEFRNIRVVPKPFQEPHLQYIVQRAVVAAHGKDLPA